MKRNLTNYIKEYGVQLFLSKSLRRIVLSSNSLLAETINSYNEKLVTKKLSEIFTREKIEEDDLFQVKKDIRYSPIWIMWWQGYDQAPDLVRSCIDVVRSKNSEHPVIIIDKNNYKEYITLPTFIEAKKDQGIISPTHLSDMIRVCLLYIYGGIWCDATLLDTQKIPEYIFQEDFYTIKTGFQTKEPSHGEWTTFFMESKPKNVLMREVAIDHFKFWKNHNELIDYIMFDYIIRMLVNSNQKVAQQIKKVPLNNQLVFELASYLDTHDTFTKDSIDLFDSDSYLFKLSWKDKRLQRDRVKKLIDSFN